MAHSNVTEQLSTIDLSFLPEPPVGREWFVDKSPTYSKSTFDLTLVKTTTQRATFWCCIAFIDDNDEHQYVTEVDGITEQVLLNCAEQTLRMLDLQY